MIRGGRAARPSGEDAATGSADIPRSAVVFAALQALAIVSFVLLTGHIEAQGVVFGLSRLVATAAVALGAWHAKPAHRREWFLILLSVVLWDIADAYAAVHTVANGHLTAWFDLSMLTVVGSTIAGIAIIRMTGKEGMLRGSPAWLEAAVGAAAMTLLWWILNGHGTLLHGHPGPHDIAANLYALCDIVSVASCTMLFDSRVGHYPWTRLLALGLTLSMLIDLVLGTTWAGSLHIPFEVTVTALILMYACLGGAALLNRIEPPRRSERSPASGLGVVVLLLALVVPPGALALTLLVRPWLADPDLGMVVLGGTAVLAVLAGARIRILMRELERQADEIERTARTDDLTQLPNRRAGTRILGTAIEAQGGRARPLSVAMIDLDHFKDYNDTRGHLQGDQLLVEAATAWSATLGSDGLLFRFGGEEFVVVLPGLDADAARRVVDRMQAVTPAGQSFSAGITQQQPGDDVQSLLERADTGLYAAKSAGRARSVVH